MITHTVDIALDNYRDEWTIYPLGDIHLGNVGFDKLALRKTVQEIQKRENIVWIGMGDYGEFISHLDPRFDPENVDRKTKVQQLQFFAQHQVDEIEKELAPIANKCVGIKRGNHEKVISDRFLYDPAHDLAKRFNTKYLGYESMTRFYVSGKDGRKRYSVVAYAHHGFGGGKKPGSHANNLLDLAAYYEADLYITGHVHRLQSIKSTKLIINTSGKLLSRDVAFVNSGTYLRMKQEGMEGYEVKKGLPPTVIGSPHININYARHNSFSLEVVI